MNEEILNSVYNASVEFGENFRKPIIEIIEKLYPNISSDEKILLQLILNKQERL